MPRRPQQARSRATVEALLEATAEVLVDEGYARASTNRIADRAGVSVGSLYQYFANKDALVRALIERHIAEQGDALRAALRSLGGQSLPEAIRDIVRAAISVRRLDKRLTRVLYTLLPQIEDMELLRAWRQRAATAVEFALAVRDDVRDVDLELASFLMVSAVDGMVGMALVAREEMLDHPDFVDEVAEMVARYLTPAQSTSDG